MKRTVIALAAAALLLGGCAGGETGSKNEDPPVGTNSDETVDETSEDDSDDDSSGASKARQISFGETYSYESGLSITVDEPIEFTPSNSSAGAEGEGTPLSFEVTVVNQTGDVFEVSMMSFSLQSGNAEAESIYDSAQNYSGAPTTDLLDGRESKFKIAFQTSRPDDLVLSVSPDWEIEYADFFVTN